jgi:hypothetical protein
MTNSTTTRFIQAFFIPGTVPSDDRPFTPEVDQRIDVFGDRNCGTDFENVLCEHVALERSHEQQGGGWRIGDAQHSRAGGALEIVDDDAQAAARWTVFAARVEWQDDGRPVGVGVHGHDQARRDHALHERDEALRQPAQYGARILERVRRGEIANALRRLDDIAGLHRGAEQGLFRPCMPEDRRGCYPELGGDVGERRCRETLCPEDAPGAVEELLAVDGGWAAHL